MNASIKLNESDYPLTASHESAAYDTLRQAAESGHWSAAAMALQAHYAAQRIVVSGDGWAVTYVVRSDDDSPTYRTVPVLGFNISGAVLPYGGDVMDLDDFLDRAAAGHQGLLHFEVWRSDVDARADVEARLLALFEADADV